MLSLLLVYILDKVSYVVSRLCYVILCMLVQILKERNFVNFVKLKQYHYINVKTLQAERLIQVNPTPTRFINVPQ